MEFPDRIKLPIKFDHVRMCQDLETLVGNEWVAHFVKENFEGDWSIIPLRGPKGETHPIRMSYSDPSQNEFVDTCYLKQTTYLPEVISWFKCQVKSVRLMKLSAGSIIKKHSDLDLAIEHGEARLHVPIQTNADVHFYLNDIEVNMNLGECWYLRLSEPHHVDNNSQSDRIHLVLDVVVNDWLKQQLQLTCEQQENETSSIKTIVYDILDESNPVYTLRPQVIELAQRLKDLVNTNELIRDRIDEGETATDTGLAVSPTMAIMCTDDYARTVQFIRGLHSAILDVNKLKPNIPAQVLYAGTGPLATLAIPLMHTLNKHQAKFTLLDIHQISIDSIIHIVHTLKLDQSVNSIERIDAFDYLIDDNNPPDIIILEIMQACLAKEPQVAVSHHLIKQAPKAILIPQEISIELVMIDCKNEFQFNGEGNAQTRIRLGSALTINKEQLLAQPFEEELTLPPVTIYIPETIPEHLDANLFTTITTYKHHELKDYDSGLTCPRSLNCVPKMSLGDTLEFNYKITNQPELKALVVN